MAARAVESAPSESHRTLVLRSKIQYHASEYSITLCCLSEVRVLVEEQFGEPLLERIADLSCVSKKLVFGRVFESHFLEPLTFRLVRQNREEFVVCVE